MAMSVQSYIAKGILENMNLKRFEGRKREAKREAALYIE